MRQGSTTNPLSWQGNINYRKIYLDYASLGRAFRNFFSLQNCIRVFVNTMIEKTMSPWRKKNPEFTYKVISDANIVHIYFSLLTLSVNSHWTEDKNPIFSPAPLCPFTPDL